MNLSELKIGQSAVILKVGSSGSLHQHFLDMGLIPKTEVTLIKLAPMGDPMELRVRRYELTLRLDDAKKIEIDDRMSGNYIHQRMAVEAFFKRRFGIIVVPTRGGKTFIASEIIRIFLQTDKGNFIFLTDNTTLHKQAVDDITAYFQRYGGIDIGEIKAGKIDVSKRVTVGMIQTIQRVLKKDYADKKKQKELKK